MGVFLLTAQLADLHMSGPHIVCLPCDQRTQITWKFFLQHIGVCLLGKILAAFALVQNRAIRVILYAGLHCHPSAMHDCRRMSHVCGLSTESFHLNFELMSKRGTLG